MSIISTIETAFNKVRVSIKSLKALSSKTQLTPFSITEEDVEGLNAYNDAIRNGANPQAAYYSALQNCSDGAKDLAASCEGAVVSQEKIETALQNTTAQMLKQRLAAAGLQLGISAITMLSQKFSKVEGTTSNAIKAIVAGILLVGTITVFAIKMANTAIWGFMSSNPIGWILLALTAVVAAIKAIVESIISFANSSTQAKEKAVEAAKELKEAWEDAKEALEDAEDELKNITDRIDELQKLSNGGTITLVEANELEKLKETEALLKSELETLRDIENLKRVEAEKAASEAVGTILNEKLSDAYVNENNTFWMGVARSLSSVLSLGISDAFGFGISDWSVKTTLSQEYVNQILGDWQSATDQQRGYVLDFYNQLQEQKDMLTYHSGENLEQWQRDANEAYNTYWQYVHRILLTTGSADSAKTVWTSALSLERFDEIEKKLKQIASTGDSTADSMEELFQNDLEFKKFVYYLENIGLIADIDKNAFEQLANQVNDMRVEIITAVPPVEQALTNFKSILDTIKEAQDEYNKTGSVSALTYNKVVAIGEDYADLFTFANGKIEMSASKTNDLVDSLISEYGATLAANGATQDQISTMVSLAKSLEMADTSTKSLVDTIKDLADVLQDAIDGEELSVFKTFELLQSYPELAGAIQKTTNGYILETEAVKELIKAKAELIQIEASKTRTSARTVYAGNSSTANANAVEKIFADYYQNNGTNIKSLDEFFNVSGSNSLIAEGLEEYVNAIIQDINVNNVMSSLVEDLKNPDVLLTQSGSKTPIQDAFDDIESLYSNRLSQLNHLSKTYENEIQSVESQGYTASVKYYNKLADVEKQKISLMEDEVSELTQKFQDAIKSGEIQRDTDEFHKMNNAINSVKESIQSANLQLQEYSNTIQQMGWDVFDKQQDAVSRLTDESNFLIKLMSDSDLIDDDGNLTASGQATMGLHGINYNVYMKKSQDYADEIAKIEKELASDPSNQKLIDRKQELLGLQRDSIQAAEDERKAMSDLIKNGINKQIEAFNNLIDKYKEALDSAKDLYEYSNKISDITQEIGKLQKQLIAYENDDSEEMRAQIQKLKVDLEDAQKELQETEYNQFIADQKQLLDNLKLEYETTLNERFDNVDTLISDAIAGINANAETISETLNTVSESVGTTLTDEMKNIWSPSDGTYGQVVSNFKTQFGDFSKNVSTYAGDLSSINTESTRVGKVIDSIKSSVSTISGKNYNPNINITIDNSGGANSSSASASGTSGSVSVKEVAPKTIHEDEKPNNIQTGSSSSSTSTTPREKTEAEKIAEKIVKFGNATGKGMSASSNGDNGEITWNNKTYKVQNDHGTKYDSNTAIYKAAVDILGFADRQIFGYNGDVYGYLDKHIQRLECRPMSKNGYNDFVKDMKANYPAFASGGLADFTGVAWLDGTKTKPEMVLDAEDTENFIALRNILQKLSENDIGFGNGYYSATSSIGLRHNIPNMGEIMSRAISESHTQTVENHIEITIPIDHVLDYNEMLSQMQSDPKFEKLLKAMTIDRMFGKGSLTKYNVKWNK